MVLRGLTKYGYHTLAYEIARDYLKNVVEVYEKTGTLWENYSPECAAQGAAKADFVGWTGLAPINILFEYVFGIQADMQEKKIVWRVNCKERHGIENYPFGDGTVSLMCDARMTETEEPRVTVKSNKPVIVEIIWKGGKKCVGATL